MNEKRLCGLRPTGRLHLGHYSSVIRPALDFGCTVLVADYHVTPADDQITVAKGCIDTLFRLGVKDIVRQEIDQDVYFRLLNLAKIGELSRMTQYKSADVSDRTAHLLTYPVLMAHDVVGYDAVYVGEDQKQHLEYARVLLQRAGLKAPRAEVIGGRVMDLRDPTKKMSKSSPDGCLFLDDDEPTIRKKLKAAVTTVEGKANLDDLYERFVGGTAPTTNYVLKTMLADALVRKFVIAD